MNHAPYWPHSDPEPPPPNDPTPPPTCCACPRPLGPYEPLTCHHCQQHTRTTLADILTLYTTLPDHIRHLTGITGGRNREKHPTTPLPGGDALVLLAAGSMGYDDNADTTRDDDPPSATQILAVWEDRWRKLRGEPAAPTTATITTTADYLDRHIQWASNTDPHFAILVTELRHLKAKMRVVTGTISPPQQSDAHCLNGECGGRLEQKWRDDGLDDTRVCPDCHRAYTPAQYNQALKWQLQQEAPPS